MSLNLTTRKDYKNYSGIKSTNYDQEIDKLIPRVSQLVKNYCNRSFVDYYETNKVEIFHGATHSFLLSECPVILVKSVEYSSNYGQTYTTLTQYVDWVQIDDEVQSTSNNGFLKKLQGYRVTYTAGYEDTPPDLELAVMDLITYYRQNDMAVHSTKSPGTNNVQIEYISTTNLPSHIKRVLDLYKVHYG